MKYFFCKVAILLALLISFGCATPHVNFRTFTDPSIQTSAIKNIAILPIRNSRILPGESNEMIRALTREILKLNPKISILTNVKAIELLNKNNMTEKYSDFLRDYATSGIPNLNVLKEIGQILTVDAILQGEVFDISQQNGHYPGVMAYTSLSLRYYLLSTIKANVLWESRCSVSVQASGTVWAPPPPIIEVINIAQDKILTNLPLLSESN